jgi:hypothetical protein
VLTERERGGKDRKGEKAYETHLEESNREREREKRESVCDFKRKERERREERDRERESKETKWIFHTRTPKEFFSRYSKRNFQYCDYSGLKIVR